VLELLMAHSSDMANKRFGLLKVVSRYGKDNRNNATWQCVCDCGGKSIVSTSDLNKGRTNSCGCLRRERMKNLNKSHGQSYSKTYQSWVKAKDRCFNPKHVAFHKYGGAGITVCDRWKNSFENFYADMGDPPTEKHSLDRIENSKGYDPENCRWATKKQQSENSSWPRLITFHGETKNLSEWARSLGMNINSVRTRIESLGWPLDRALTELPRKTKRTTKFSPR
jgi:hypothetical protein